MFHYCLMLVLLLIVLIKNDKTIEGVADGQGGTHTPSSVLELTQQQQNDELKRIRSENYADAKGFENMLAKGICTNEPHTKNNHSCKILDAKKTKPTVDLRYINPGASQLDKSNTYTYMGMCASKYKEAMDALVSENLKPHPELYKMTLDPNIPNPKNFFKNKYSRGQYPGYSRNNYLDRTRYVKSEEPLPVNPDFFMDGGGTYA